MKTSLKGTLAALLAAVPAYASAGNQAGHGLLMTLFFGFAAMVIVFQLVPAAVLLFGMAKGAFSESSQAQERRS